MVKVKAKHRKKYVILPLSLLVFNVIHEIIVYKCQQFSNPFLLTAVLMIMFLFGFAFVGLVLSPFLEKSIERIYITSKKGAGFVGEVVIVILFFGGLFYLYYQIYASPNGVENLLPARFLNP